MDTGITIRQFLRQLLQEYSCVQRVIAENDALLLDLMMDGRDVQEYIALVEQNFANVRLNVPKATTVKDLLDEVEAHLNGLDVIVTRMKD